MAIYRTKIFSEVLLEKVFNNKAQKLYSKKWKSQQDTGLLDEKIYSSKKSKEDSKKRNLVLGAAGLGVAGLTAYLALKKHKKPGKSINNGTLKESEKAVQEASRNVQETRNQVIDNISQRHEDASNIIKDTVEKIKKNGEDIHRNSVVSVPENEIIHNTSELDHYISDPEFKEILESQKNHGQKLREDLERIKNEKF